MFRAKVKGDVDLTHSLSLSLPPPLCLSVSPSLSLSESLSQLREWDEKWGGAEAGHGDAVRSRPGGSAPPGPPGLGTRWLAVRTCNVP